MPRHPDSANRAAAAESDPLLGPCRDEAELMDDVTERAMKSREDDPLRVDDG